MSEAALTRKNQKISFEVHFISFRHENSLFILLWIKNWPLKRQGRNWVWRSQLQKWLSKNSKDMALSQNSKNRKSLWLPRSLGKRNIKIRWNYHNLRWTNKATLKILIQKIRHSKMSFLTIQHIFGQITLWTRSL